MGHDVYRDVLDNAPADLGAAERIILLVLADLANEATRECRPTLGVVEHQTGLSAETLRKAFQRLARRPGGSLDPRIKIATDRRGRAVFAYAGVATRYRVPTFGPRQMPYRRTSGGGIVKLDPEQWREGIPTTSGSRGGNAGSEWRDQGPSEVGTQGLSGGTVVPPIPCSQDPSSSLAAPAVSAPPQEEEGNPEQLEPASHPILAARGVTADEQSELYRRWKRSGVNHPPGVVSHRAGNGQLDADLAEIRRARSGSAGADWRRSLEGKPRCPHQMDGGRELNPSTGKAACRKCQDQPIAAGPHLAIVPGLPLTGEQRAAKAAEARAVLTGKAG